MDNCEGLDRGLDLGLSRCGCTARFEAITRVVLKQGDERSIDSHRVVFYDVVAWTPLYDVNFRNAHGRRATHARVDVRILIYRLREKIYHPALVTATYVRRSWRVRLGTPSAGQVSDPSIVIACPAVHTTWHVTLFFATLTKSGLHHTSGILYDPTTNIPKS